MDPQITWLSDVEVRDVDWFWRHRIPRGQVTIIDGDPGESKSVLTLELAATTSTGRPWPDGAASTQGTVLIVSPEDEMATTIKPRVLAAGGDPARVAVWKQEFTLTEPHLTMLEAESKRLGVVLAIIDPLSTAIPGGVNGWNDAEMRRVLRPLQELARNLNLAVVVVRHLNKGSGKAIYRGQGTIGIVAAVRMALLVSRDPEDSNRRILAVEKSNLGPFPPSLAYRLAAVPVAALKEPIVRVVWEGESALSAETLLASEGETKGDDAKGFLNEVLADGPLPSEEIIEMGKQQGIGKNRIWEAKKQLGVAARKRGFADGWEWYLPAKRPGPAPIPVPWVPS